MTKSSISTDVAIIGAGPTGLFAAFECSMLKMTCVLIDTLEHVGGQCSALYPEKPIYDIPAHPAITAQSLIDSLEKQIEPFSVPRLLSKTVTTLKGEKGNFTLITQKGDEIHAKAIIIAAGAGSFGPNRPPLDNIEQFEKAGNIHYYVRYSDQFIGKDIVIAGGGDSAVDWALALKDKANSISLIHRRDRFRAAPESLCRLEQAINEQKINKLVPYQLHALRGEQGCLNEIDVISLDGEIKSLKADHLLAFFGLTTDLGALKDWGFEINQGRIPVNQTTLQTSQEGIYAIGDIAQYPGKLKLILQGFSEAAMAAHDVYSVVYPDLALHFEHSTTQGIPQ
ncbi:NAD(P)/FAD-dependent oxidoreductase [Commensalibacter communis]|uniref:NAD(P)/FAD-dependent oxidoreductase n=1 Tax=Commensalibacter communis TaxID=2972786 RepID=UPI0022FF7AE1|nr:NAD(P)/FAD-dependent oxidoreductase [Commensalibacter communis]CAI3922393.1 Thioredoxin reductase (TrxB) (PDB:3FBS) [Commensalibacter communis]CAI3932558.1 Thioredoxin reductase (TrxB) (PDB:3FBS) [Commensalibacter communis]